jgi:two-component sensor histidine kinase
MLDYLRSWLEPSAFSPHGFCLLWEPGLLWLHAGSDALTALAYLSIPVALLAFLRRRRDVSFGWMGGLFAAFILLCGATHIMGLVTLWSPLYWLQGAIKLATALVSVATAILLWPLIPRALAIPSGAALQGALAEKEAAVAQLRDLAANLERRVAERTAELAEANARYRIALEASGVTVFAQDSRLAYTWVSRPDLGMQPADFLGRTDDELMPGAEGATLTAIKRRVIETGQPERAELPARGRWFQCVFQPERGGGLLGGAVDITERRRQEARIGFLANELKHRAANLLAVVQAMLRQTAATAATPAEVEERLGGRLASLAASQRILARGDAEAASLRETIAGHIGHHLQGQVEIAGGPDLRLPADAALHIGMALHELSTNAAKYGALSVPQGRVRVGWEVLEGANCRLFWEERGGPPVLAPPARRGFGREVVEWAVAQAVRGEVKLDFPRAGARWELVFPLAADRAAELATA